ATYAHEAAQLGAVAELDTGLGRLARERQREQGDVAGFIVKRVVATRDELPRRRQRWLYGHDLIGAHDAAIYPIVAHDLRDLLRHFEFLGTAIEIEYAAFLVIVFDAKFPAHFTQQSATVLRHGHQCTHVACHPVG